MYQIGEIRRRCDVGLKGRQTVTWMACSICSSERWVNPSGYAKNVCSTCYKRNRAFIINLNSFVHKPECKCGKCRAGKGYFKGDKNPCWNGGLRKTSGGYIYQWVSDDHPFVQMRSSYQKNSNYIMQHRLVMAEHLGRPLKKEETVHHINGIRDDNRIENLELWSSNHQSGQRVEDQIKWAIAFLEENNYSVNKKSA